MIGVLIFLIGLLFFGFNLIQGVIGLFFKLLGFKRKKSLRKTLKKIAVSFVVVVVGIVIAGVFEPSGNDILNQQKSNIENAIEESSKEAAEEFVEEVESFVTDEISNIEDVVSTFDESFENAVSGEIFQTEDISLDEIPAYTGDPYVVLKNNIPSFSEDAKKSLEGFEEYSNLDSLGRCGVAFANICKKIMPTEERGQIGSVKPSGWHTVKYDCVDGKYLYNRCHLIGYQLSGENANERNLITGTRYLNVEGMLPFENMIDDYVEETNHHVLYRVTPVFDGDNLLASGVQLEAWSVEDNGEGICFNVYCYNVQPGVTIDYSTGTSELAVEDKDKNLNGSSVQENTTTNISSNESSTSNNSSVKFNTYILNSNTKKFHEPDCGKVKQIKEKNKKVFEGSKEDVVAQGYEACKNCNP